MREQIEALVSKHGFSAVLATLSASLRKESDELEEMGNDADNATAEQLDELRSQLLKVAQAYDALGK